MNNINYGVAIKRSAKNDWRQTGFVTISHKTAVVGNMSSMIRLRRRVVVQSVQEAGNYQVQIDCSGLQPGIYYYEMACGKGKLSKKLMIIR